MAKTYSFVLFLFVFILSCGSDSPNNSNQAPPAVSATNSSDGKISSDLLQKLNSKTLLSTSGFKIAIKLKEGEDGSDILDAGTVRYRAGKLVNAVFADLDRAKVLQLADDSRIEKIEENYDVKINLLYATKQIGVRDSWPTYTGVTFGGSSDKIRLAVIDTGIDDAHLDFAGRILKKANCYQTTCVENSGYNDDHGHGSHVSGIVLGSGSSWDPAGDSVNIEIKGTLKAALDATRYFFPAQFLANPSGNLAIDMTWSATSATSADVAFQDKTNAEALNNTYLFTESGIKTGPSVAPGTFFASSNYAVTGTAGNLIMPHAFTAFTSDSNAVGQEFWAKIKTVVQGWGDGKPRMAGVSYGSELVAIKSLSADGSGSVDDIVRSLEYVSGIAESNNIVAVNLSFSVGNGLTSAILKTAVASLVAKGIAVVVSAGNEQQQGATISSPGDAETVITVGAVNDQNQVTSYSSIGSLSATIKKPDILAPGGSTVTRNYIIAPKTTYVDSKWNRSQDASITVDPYALKIGTSQAAPFVTGLIGVMASKRAGSWSFNSSTVPLFFKMIICMTAFETGARESQTSFMNAPITPERAGGLKDRVEGYGRISAQGALSVFDNGAMTDSFTLGSNVYDQKSFVRPINLSSSKEYNFTMSVPSGTDFDLYLFNGSPDANGDPILLASSALVSNPTERIIDYIPPQDGTYYLVSKWISGSGTTNFVQESERDKPATPTQILDFRVDRNMRDKKITVSWKTNVPAVSTIQYGATGGLGSEQSSSEYKTEHSFVFDIVYDSYYYVRGLSTSTGDSDLTRSTAVSPVYRSSTYGELEKDISVEDLPVVPNVGGCGAITTSGNSGFDSTGFSAIIALLLPFTVMLIIRKRYFLGGSID